MKRKNAKPFVPARSMLAVYSGREAVGFFMDRGRDGTECFDDAGNSLGLFPSRDAAAEALYQRRAS